MLTKRCHIAIAEGEMGFGVRLKNILQEMSENNSSITFSIDKVSTVKEIKNSLKKKLDVIFMDCGFILKNSKQLKNVWLKQCRLVLMIKDSANEQIEVIMKELNKYSTRNPSFEIMKESYSRPLFNVMIRDLIKSIRKGIGFYDKKIFI